MCGKPDAFAVFFAIILFVAGVGIICRLSVARRNTSGDNIEMATTRRSRSLAVLDSRQVERVPRAHLGRRREVVATPHYEMPASRNSWLPFRKVLVVGGAGRGEEEENTGVEVAPPAYSAIQGN